jgi:NAD+ diphosphatase
VQIMTQQFPVELPLSRSGIDRSGADREDPALLETLWSDPTARAVVLAAGRALLAAGTSSRLALLPTPGLPEDALRLYLGRTTAPSEDGPAGTPVLAVVLDEQRAAELEPEGDRWAELRTAGADLDARDAGLFTEALALANWHRSHGYSPRSGVPTVPGRAGWVRYPEGADDEASGEHVFPRTDPAVIVGVVDPADRLLLASNVAWPEDRFSVLAGFVEPGESLEGAVVREVGEESGVRVRGVQYLGSQPWPFPASVMVGFLAEADPDGPLEPVADGIEIREVRWFSREELSSAVAGGLRLPGPTSIARAIVEHWYGGPIQDEA